LVDHIEAKHHAYLKEALPEISERLAVVLRAHGQHHPELFQVHGVFGQVRTDLEQHLVKEEVLLFPALSRGTPDAETRALAQTLRDEHTAVGEMLRTLRRLNHDYVAPDDACPTYRRLLKELETMEADLFQHIHLENNILLQGV
jgi:regulator of cell morphogenesis and NO signaling